MPNRSVWHFCNCHLDVLAPYRSYAYFQSLFTHQNHVICDTLVIYVKYHRSVAKDLSFDMLTSGLICSSSFHFEGLPNPPTALLGVVCPVSQGEHPKTIPWSRMYRFRAFQELLGLSAQQTLVQITKNAQSFTRSLWHFSHILWSPELKKGKDLS